MKITRRSNPITHARRLLLAMLLCGVATQAHADSRSDPSHGLVFGVVAADVVELHGSLTAPITGQGAPHVGHGIQVAIRGDFINGNIYAISAYTRRGNSQIHVFKSEAGQWVHKPAMGMTATTGTVQSMDFDGQRLIFGVRPVDPDRSGTVYILRLDPYNDRWTVEYAAGYLDANPDYGSSVAISGHFAVAGRPLPAGSVYPITYRAESGWTRAAALIGGTQIGGSELGRSVALRDGRLAVGDPKALFWRGRVKIWEQHAGDWVYQGEILRPEGELNDARFGHAVALHGEVDSQTGQIAHRLLVGAPGDFITGGAAGMGRAYLYAREAGAPAYVLRDSLQAPTPAANDNFGEAVSIDGAYALIGAPGRSVGGQADRGEVFALRNSFSGLEGGLTAFADPQGSAGDSLGLAIAVADTGSGPRWLLGSPLVTSNGNPGQGVVLAGSGSVQTPFPTAMQRLELGQGLQGAKFGSALSADDGSLFVSAPSQAVGSQLERGVVYYFPDPVGNPQDRQQILAPDGVAGDRFGFSIAHRGNLLVVGVPDRIEAALSAAGAVYAFRRGGDGQWTFLSKKIHDSPQVGGRFGASVAVPDEQHMLVSTQANDGVYLFHNTSGSLWAEVDHIPRLASWWHPYLVTDGSNVAITEPFWGEATDERRGAVRVYQWSDGKLVGPRLHITGNQLGQELGIAIDFDGDRLVLLSQATEVLDKGLVQIFGLSTDTEPPLWLPEASFAVEPLNRPVNFLGFSGVALRGNTLAISSGTHQATQDMRGGVFLYRHSAGQWQHRQTLGAEAFGAQQPRIGISGLAWLDGYVAVAAPLQHVAFEEQGRVHILSLVGDAIFASGFE